MTVVIVAFFIGGLAVIGHWWVVLWVCAGVVVLSVPAGKVIGIMEDTVQIKEAPRARAAVSGPDSAADPGVRLD